ncbi:MAG: Methylated-DNA--protein-cysteine methyltransferase [Catillopecten margaritatus gill symbiont]|uniref:methylated-DNA--[protein]-cysteine S-methyltransferase n=1 Tax=Catillopecten margaritatus gill symbiont TaxID=3083288 RepID=A0AAU6PGS7_9GAMM
MEEGFRPCKMCRPLSSEFDNETYIYEYIRWLEKNQFPDKSYRKHPISSLEYLTKIKKDFQKAIGISLGKYIRIKRVNHILENDTSEQKHPNKIFFNRLLTPIGEMIFCYTDEQLHLLEFVDRRMLETELQLLKDKLKGFFVKKQSKFSNKVLKQMEEYFDKSRTSFSIDLGLIGTDFQKNAWGALINIPHGTTMSYKEQADYLNNPSAVRAIASANGKNMIAIIVPCHRVIGSDGKMAGYGGGIERKKYLINLEGGNVK